MRGDFRRRGWMPLQISGKGSAYCHSINEDIDKPPFIVEVGMALLHHYPKPLGTYIYIYIYVSCVDERLNQSRSTLDRDPRQLPWMRCLLTFSFADPSFFSIWWDSLDLLPFVIWVKKPRHPMSNMATARCIPWQPQQISEQELSPKFIPFLWLDVNAQRLSNSLR